MDHSPKSSEMTAMRKLNFYFFIQLFLDPVGPGYDRVGILFGRKS